jgi:hypothetical protein
MPLFEVAQNRDVLPDIDSGFGGLMNSDKDILPYKVRKSDSLSQIAAASGRPR